ncbi:MAG TPA: pyruvate kinase [Dongiaceae bacterium]|jgi:pyruvate kinase|nr:pyruvate kinase [Dongiaceae bacterium]
MRRQRKAKIVATLGPATTSRAVIDRLFEAGADVFRLNFSHGRHEDHRDRHAVIRAIEKKRKRPIGILMDLQGPKLRIGTFAQGPVMLSAGQTFRLDLENKPGDQRRVYLPHPEIFAALRRGMRLLLDDGRIQLRASRTGKDFAECDVLIGGALSERKGVNVPDALLNLTPLTPKDRRDLRFGLELGVDWVALSFVQRPDDIREAQALIKGKARIAAKLEKPAAIENLDEIVALSDAVMVARGDLGVEMPAEDVPILQKRIIAACRREGKPVIVATQMLDSMVHAPTPTRAEASDVATAIYDGADAVMLSAETASGDYPVEAVAMMDRIIGRVERDPAYTKIMSAQHPEPQPTGSDAISSAAAQVAHTLSAAAIVTFTSTGSTGLRVARERPEVPILCLTPWLLTARQMSLVWGTHCVPISDPDTFGAMVTMAEKVAVREAFAAKGDRLVVTAGVPIGTAGSTNTLRVTKVK